MGENTDLNTIRTAGKKEVPGGTMLELRVGSKKATVSVRIKLPGQKDFSNYTDLPIIDGVLELPVKLIFLSYAREDQRIVQEIADKLWQDGFLTWLDKKDLK